ncbi:MAG: DsbA family protein [Pseudonocardia sp.]
MGGASRNDRKRQQEEVAQRLSAAGITPPERRAPSTTLIVIGILVVVAVVAVVGVLFTRGSANTASASYPLSASGAVITAGQPSAPVTVDVYVDYLCSHCERFEQRYGDELITALNDGQISARFHPVTILDGRSDPPGYSSRAANAALCSVPAGIFPAYNDKLFAEQPSMGSAGPSDDQLIAFGTELGASGDFADCVRSGSNGQAVAAATQAAETDPVLGEDGGFGTPTVVVDGRKIDVSDGGWLTNAIAAG